MDSTHTACLPSAVSPSRELRCNAMPHRDSSRWRSKTQCLFVNYGIQQEDDINDHIHSGCWYGMAELFVWSDNLVYNSGNFIMDTERQSKIVDICSYDACEIFRPSHCQCQDVCLWITARFLSKIENIFSSPHSAKRPNVCHMNQISIY
jgi:hypothetical protein